MTAWQPGILEPVPDHGRYLEFSAGHDADVRPALVRLTEIAVAADLVIGLGPGLVAGLGRQIAGHRPFPALSGPGCEVPSSQADLWVWLRGSDRGHIANRARALGHLLAPAFDCDTAVDGFRFDRGLDLSGYEDGTENPEGEAAIEAAIVQGAGPGLDGASFVAVQQWLHDLDHFEALPQDERDNIIGRRLSDNEELDDAPASAHVKRTAQESFEPEAFVLRRSMPWSEADGEGLMFVAFGHTLDAFEAQLRRMAGQEDGVTDGLFRFSRPISGGYYWCPPLDGDRLNLAALGL